MTRNMARGKSPLPIVIYMKETLTMARDLVRGMMEIRKITSLYEGRISFIL